MENYIPIVKLILYFIFYSFCGWIMESILKTYLQKKLVNSGFLYGPLCPIYGFGAIIMILFLDIFKNNIFLLFLMSFFVLSIWEYIVGWLLEKIFKAKYWDYTDNKFNIKGRVCLMNSLFWGILGVLFTKFIHPFIISKIDLIPQQAIVFLTAILLFAILVDLVISIVKATNIRSKLEKLKDLTNTLKEKLEELENKQINLESVQEVIEELKYKQTKLKRKLLKQSSHLRKAFPTMKSDALEKINEFLNQKKDMIKKGKDE